MNLTEREERRKKRRKFEFNFPAFLLRLFFFFTMASSLPQQFEDETENFILMAILKLKFVDCVDSKAYSIHGNQKWCQLECSVCPTECEFEQFQNWIEREKGFEVLICCVDGAGLMRNMPLYGVSIKVIIKDKQKEKEKKKSTCVIL
jgi:hypothetical protein